MSHKVSEPDYHIQLSLEQYEYDYIGIWVTTEGYFLGTDSGCSCPTPWENHTEDDLTGPLTYDQMLEEVYSLVEAVGRKASDLAKLTKRAQEALAGPQRLMEGM